MASYILLFYMQPINHLYSIEPCDVASSVRTWIDSPQAAPWLLIEASPDATHGAGIFAYKTELLGLDKYSSTMGCIWDHHPASNSMFFSNRLQTFCMRKNHEKPGFGGRGSAIGHIPPRLVHLAPLRTPGLRGGVGSPAFEETSRNLMKPE